MIQGLASTIIPVYNRPAMLREAVARILGQTCRPTEIMILDNGSTDDITHVAGELPSAPGRSPRSSWAHSAVLIVGSAAILSWPLVWNRFPFVYWDTANYLTRWAVGSPVLVQPIYYSLWLGAFNSLPYGLVFCALFQSLITSFLLFFLVSHLVPESRVFIAFALSTLAIAASPTAFHITTLMPDISTTWLGFGAPILIVGRSAKSRILALSAMIVSLAFHSSHLLILVGVTPVLLLFAFACNADVRGAAALFGILLVTQFALIALNNQLAGARPLESPALFLVAARLNQSYALELSLKEAAEDERYRNGRDEYVSWAVSVDKLVREPEAFLWSEASPLNRRYPAWDMNLESYYAAKAFLNPVVAAGLRNHRIELVLSGKHNATSMMAGEYLFQGYVRHDHDSPVWKALDLRWPHDLPRYVASRQGSGELPAEGLPRFAALWKTIFYACSASSMLLSMALIIAAMGFMKLRRTLPTYLGASLVLVALFQVNVLVCGFLSSIATRYIERVVGLYCVALVILSVGCYGSMLGRIREPVRG